MPKAKNELNDPKHLRISINCGRKGEYARSIVEGLMAKNINLSKYISRIIVMAHHQDNGQDTYKKLLMFEYAEIKVKVGKLMQRKADLKAQLEDLGLKEDEL